MAYVITLTGPSRCGKSEVIKMINSISKEEKYKDIFKPVLIRKYTTRSLRENELLAISAHKEDELDVRPVLGINNMIDGVEGKDLEEKKLIAFNKIGCDLVYEQYGNRYGVKMEEIYECLKHELSPIIILNDVRTVEDIKSSLGEQCKSLFIFREIPNLEHFKNQGNERKETHETVQARFDKAVAIYRIYIENIHIFDKLILNVKDGHESLGKIIRQFLDALCVEPLEFI